jgi:hypothetical protein
MTKKPARTLDIRQAGALTATVLIVLGASLARADQRCDDIADQLETNIDGLKVGITAGNIIYLSHPQGTLAGLFRPQFQERTLCQGGQPEAEASLPRSRRQRGRNYFYPAEGQYPGRRHALHQQDRGVDCDLAPPG